MSTQMKKTSLIVAIIVAIVAISGVGYAFFVNTPKNAYLSAEVEMIETVTDDFKSRYAKEWEMYVETAQKHAVKQDYKVTANIGEIGALAMFIPVDLINGSHIEVSSIVDAKKEVLDLQGNMNIAGVTLDDLQLRLHEHDAFLTLPVLNETVTITDERLTEVIDDDEIDLDFSQYFKQFQGMNEKDVSYIKKTYSETLYEALPEDAFTKEKEKIVLFGEEKKANKIVMDLTAEEVEDVWAALLTVTRDDEKLQEILERTAHMYGALSEKEIKQSLDELNDDITEELENRSNWSTGSVRSTIWVADKIIAKRELTLDGDLAFSGEHLRNNEGHEFEYVIYDTDDDIKIAGVTSYDGEKVADDIKISVNNDTLQYKADESLSKEDHDYTRRIKLSSVDVEGTLVWTGEKEYVKEGIDSTMTFGVEFPGFTTDMASLTIDSSIARTKDSGENPTRNVKDLNDLSKDELADYLEEVAAKIEMKYSALFDNSSF